MTITGRFLVAVLICFVLAGSARAARYELAAAGTISNNASSDATIAVGTPWSFELTYDTAAPDLDFEALGAADPTYGRFKNTALPPALVAFHYRAGSYEVTPDDPADLATQVTSSSRSRGFMRSTSPFGRRDCFRRWRAGRCRSTRTSMRLTSRRRCWRTMGCRRTSRWGRRVLTRAQFRCCRRKDLSRAAA